MILPDDIVQQVVFLSTDRKLAIVVRDKYFDLPGLSKYCGLGVSTLRKYIKKRALPCFKVDGKVLVRQSEFERWLEQFRMREAANLGAIANKAVASVFGNE